MLLGDPVSMLDGNAQTTLKAPDFKLEAVTNVATGAELDF